MALKYHFLMRRSIKAQISPLLCKGNTEYKQYPTVHLQYNTITNFSNNIFAHQKDPLSLQKVPIFSLMLRWKESKIGFFTICYYRSKS